MELLQLSLEEGRRSGVKSDPDFFLSIAVYNTVFKLVEKGLGLCKN